MQTTDKKCKESVGGHRDAIVHVLILCLTGDRVPGSIVTFSAFIHHSSFFASSPSREHHTFGTPTVSIQLLFTVDQPNKDKKLQTHTAVDTAKLTTLANDIADKTQLKDFRHSKFGQGVSVGMILGSDCEDAELRERGKEVLWNAVCEEHAARYYGLKVHKVHLLLTGCIKGQVSETTCVRDTNQFEHVICSPTGSASTQTTPQVPKQPTPLSLPQFRIRASSKAFARN